MMPKILIVSGVVALIVAAILNSHRFGCRRFDRGGHTRWDRGVLPHSHVDHRPG
jgi:hypothetical protein